MRNERGKGKERKKGKKKIFEIIMAKILAKYDKINIHI